MGLIGNIISGVKSRLGIGASSDAVQQQAQADLTAYRNAGSTALNYYEGQIPKQLLVKFGEPDDNVAVNYAALIVEKGVSFLFGNDLRIEIGEADGDSDTDDLGEAEEETDEDYIDQIWPPDQRSEDFIDLGTDGGVNGDAWLKISIQADGSPLVSVLDPCNMSADTDPDNYRRVLAFRVQYQTYDANGRQILYKEETTPEADGKSWVIREFISYDAGRTWAMQPDETRWNFEFPPVFHTKNLPRSQSFYGRPDLTPYVLSLIKYLSRLDSLVGKIVRAHSSPKPYAKGMSKQELEMSTTGVLFLGQNPEAQLGLLEMTGDLAGAISFRRQLREALAEVSHVPEIASGKLDNVGQLSGLALKILYGPLIDRTKIKQRLYGRLIKDVVRALLVIGGRGDQAVTIHWPDPVPGDPKEAVETAIAKKQIGYSDDTLIQQTGGDPDQERSKRQVNSDQMGAALLDAFDKGTP